MSIPEGRLIIESTETVDGRTRLRKPKRITFITPARSGFKKTRPRRKSKKRVKARGTSKRRVRRATKRSGWW